MVALLPGMVAVAVKIERLTRSRATRRELHNSRIEWKRAALLDAYQRVDYRTERGRALQDALSRRDRAWGYGC